MNKPATNPGGSNWTSGFATLAAVALALDIILSVGRAQAPGLGESRIVQRTVRSLTTAPRGEIDGAILDDGTVIHWPPHLADRFTAIVTPGEPVEVSGRMETGPAGDTHLEVQSVTNLRTRESQENDGVLLGPGTRRGPLAPPPPVPRAGNGPAAVAARTAQGTVQRLTTAPMGKIDGAVLDDGTVIHWPPHLADRFTGVVARGDRIKVSGWMETGPAGDTHLEVQTATNLRTNASASNNIAGQLPRGPGVAPDGSGDFAAQPTRPSDLERRLKALEDQVTQLREEIRQIRDEL
jgi:hypothetical protein